MLVSFVIPAHNEERCLPATIAAIRDAARTLDLDHEIIVADDASTDRTPEIAAELGARVVRHDRRQIAATRNLGARVAGGEILFFIDADTCVNPQAVRAALDALARGAVGGGGWVRADGVIPLYARIMLHAANRIFRLCRLCGGCFVYCTREAYLRTGGWDETRYAGEEIEFAGALKAQGRFHMVRTPVTTSGRKLRTHSPREIVGVIARGAWSEVFQGGRLTRSREGLDLWYAPRREDTGGTPGNK